MLCFLARGLRLYRLYPNHLFLFIPPNLYGKALKDLFSCACTHSDNNYFVLLNLMLLFVGLWDLRGRERRRWDSRLRGL